MPYILSQWFWFIEVRRQQLRHLHWLQIDNWIFISWGSKKQRIVALSTVECEYMALTDMAKKILSIQNAMLFCDSQGAIIAAEKNPSSKYTRHFDVKRHFIKDVFLCP